MIIPFPSALRQKIDHLYELTEAIEMERAMEALADPALISAAEALSLPEERDLAVAFLQAACHVLRVARRSEAAGTTKVKEALLFACDLLVRAEAEPEIWYLTALLLKERGESTEALNLVEHYLELEDYPMREKDRTLAMAKCLRSELAMELGDAEGARRFHADARECVDQLKDNGLLGFGDFYPMHCSALSKAAGSAGNLDEAIAYLSEGISVWESDPEHNGFGALLLSREYANLGFLHGERNEWVPSAEAFQKAMEFYESPATQALPGALRSAADCGYNAGVSYLQAEQYHEAIPSLRSALRLYRALQAEDEQAVLPMIYRTCRAMDAAAWATGQREEAILRCREGLLALRRDAACDAKTLCGALWNLAERLQNTGALDEAILLLEERFALREQEQIPAKTLALELSQIALLYSLRGGEHEREDRTPEAERCLRQAWDTMRRATVLNREHLPMAEQTIRELLQFLRRQRRNAELDDVRLEYAELVNQTDA